MMLSRLLVGAALAAMFAACGKTEDKPGGSGAAPPASASAPTPPATAGASPGAAASAGGKEIGGCKINVTGDVTASAAPVRHDITDSKVSFGSDYWMSEAELKKAMQVMAGLGKDKDEKANLDAEVDKAMKNDPRFFVFILNCDDGNVSMSLLPGSESKYADIPRQPKKYVLTGGAKAGEFNVMLKVGESGFFSVKDKGTLDITRFDSSRLEGTFAFDGEERYGSKRNIKVAGSFGFDCVGSESCGK